MCGICGYIQLDEAKRPSEAILKEMTAALKSRGPDDEGLFLSYNAAMGHRRLSIIDLKTGHQPMASEDGSKTIVYNGEVYNFMELKADLEKMGHRFRTRSDTEVVLHAYEEFGEECVKLFNGMFAFAIWDSKEKSLFLVRDRFGKKPLYYAIFDNQFIFASEPKAILRHPSAKREIDTVALSKYLAYEYVPSPHSIFKNIHKLEAGTKVVLRNGKITSGRYWDVDCRAPLSLSIADAEERLVRLLKESVRRRLVSDVPLGVFLSGGVDSSAIVSLMAELMDPKDIKTFSVGFKEASFDESRDARLIAQHFGTDHHEEVVGPETMLNAIPDVFGFLDEPFADSSIIPTYLVSKFTRRHVTVALGGDGGDELFLGYPSFMAHKIDSYLSALPKPIREFSLKILDGVTPSGSNYARRFLRGMNFTESVRQQVWIGAFTPDQEKDLLLRGNLNYDQFSIYETTDRLFADSKDLDPLTRAMYIYMKTYMTDDILTKVDRASMANSLEVRSPFLDSEFADFVARLTPSFKFRHFKQKWILKDALKDKLPYRTLHKPKHGFAVPVARWLRDDLRPLLMEAFNRKKIENEGIFNYTYIEKLLGDFFADERTGGREIWALFAFEMWYDKWMR